MASYTTNVKQLYVDNRTRFQRCQTAWIRHAHFYCISKFSTVLCRVILMLLGIKAITVSLNTCISYGKCIFINVDAVGVKTIAAYLKCIFYGKYIQDKLLVPWAVKAITVHLKCILDSKCTINFGAIRCQKLILYLRCIFYY